MTDRPPHDGHPVESTQHAEGELFDAADHRPSTRRVLWALGAAGLVLVGLLAYGVVPRLAQRAADAEETRVAAAEVPKVRVVRADKSPAGTKIVLPGSVQPLQETAIYARANGYVRKWLVDIGAHVTLGQTLVQLDLPDIDQELQQAQAAALQAKATIAQVRTQLELARATNNRYSTLGQQGLISKQDVDNYQAGFDAQQANLAAAQAGYESAGANVRRLQDLKAFGTVTAPFDGVVTARSAEVGQLVSSSGTGPPLFKVAEVDVVRVFVNVPQLYAPLVNAGLDAPTSVRELPHRTFPGKVARTAHELDSANRTLLTEVDIPNADGALIAGMYASVSFEAMRTDPPLLIPSTAVMYNQQGTRVVVVTDGAVHWRDVVVEADQGARLAIASGLTEGELVAATPSERFLEGEKVRADEGTKQP